MLYYWLIFFFLAFGAKLLLALVMIYLLLPGNRKCSDCDGDTLWLQTNRAGRFGAAFTLGRVQWRWCPGCGWEGLARREPHFRPTATRSPSRGPLKIIEKRIEERNEGR